MIHNTHCKNCIFGHSILENKSCDFDIVSSIKDIKTCIVKDDYWYIKNYKCLYALGKNTYNTNIKSIVDNEKIDIKEYIVYHNTIKYYLLVDCKKDSYNIEKLCNQINELAIPPKFISILLYEQDKESLAETVQYFKTIIGNKFEYKIHNFIDKVTSDEAIFSVLETTIKKNDTQYLWILDPNSLEIAIKNESIQNINYQINILQPECNLLKSRKTHDGLDTLFLNFDNYIGMTKHINQSLSLAIQSMPNIIIENYD